MSETDEEWARRYCAVRGIKYISHETYITGASHGVWIAVEDYSGRYEVRTQRTYEQTVGENK